MRRAGQAKNNRDVAIFFLLVAGILQSTGNIIREMEYPITIDIPPLKII